MKIKNALGNESQGQMSFFWTLNVSEPLLSIYKGQRALNFHLKCPNMNEGLRGLEPQG